MIVFNFRSITILSFRVIFPYRHNFAEAFQDEFISLNKWIKLIHNFKKTEFSALSPLPSDLFIKVNFTITSLELNIIEKLNLELNSNFSCFRWKISSWR